MTPLRGFATLARAHSERCPMGAARAEAMLSARLPDNENMRLEALRSYAVLDGPKEAAVDALVRVASCVCEVPIAVVTLVDAVRQCFLSSSGLDVSDRSVSS